MKNNYQILWLFLFALPALVGDAAAQWSLHGTAVCTETGYQNYVQVAEDTAGGAFLVWLDSRFGGSTIFAQRVDGRGRPLWVAEGVSVCPVSTGNQSSFDVAPDGSGGVIVVWRDGRIPEGIYGQRLDGDGNPLWNPDGAEICIAQGMQHDPQAVADGAGGAVVTWYESRNADDDIFAQRVDAAGSSLWTVDGVTVCGESGIQEAARIATDGEWFFIAWEDLRGADRDIYAQKLDATGAEQWAIGGVAACLMGADQRVPQIIPTWYGGAMVAWEDTRSGIGIDIGVNHLNIVGTAQWGGGGLLITDASSSGLLYQNPVLVPDGVTAGAVVVWEGGGDIFAQRLNGYGMELWSVGGVIVCGAPYQQFQPRAVHLADGGTAILWADGRVPYETDIYAQKLDSQGLAAWQIDGVPVETVPSGYSWPGLATDGFGGAIIAWHEVRDGAPDSDIYAQRIEQNGYWGFPAPEVFGVTDVPGDQGGEVMLSWYASRLDPLPEASITHYSVWRAITSDTQLASPGPESAAVKPLPIDGDKAESPPVRSQILGDKTFFWEYLETVSAFHLSTYGTTAPTLFDSTSTSPEWQWFQVIAHTADPLTFWISEPDSGRSVDNLAPAAPANLEGRVVPDPVGLELSWAAGAEDDLDHYVVHRGNDPGFVPDPANLVATTPDTVVVDATWGWGDGLYYKVAAYDVHGNLGAFAALDPAGVSAVESSTASPGYACRQNWPNPFNAATTIRYELGNPQAVRLQVYDISGRLVRTLVDSEQVGAGSHDVVWHGRDDLGRLLASGVYFYRLEAGGFKSTKRMILVK